MELDIRKNMYVRTKDGEMHKIKSINNEYIEYENGFGIPYELKEDIVKASYNIIDILEVGDIIATNNLCGQITKIDKEHDRIWTTCYDGEYCSSDDIKEVLTREQFKASSCRIGNKDE